MKAEGLGKLIAQPTRSQSGDLIYYETENHFGVHIETDTGKVISVRDTRTGTVIQREDIDYAEYKTDSMTIAEALNCQDLLTIDTVHGNRLIGRIIGYENTFGTFMDSGTTSISVALLGGEEATISEDSITNITGASNAY